MFDLVPRGLEGQHITENRGPGMAKAIYAMHGLAAMFCIARFLTRGLLLRAFGKDDYMMMITLVFSSVVTATVPLQVNSGAGIHFTELTDSQRSYVQKMAWLSQVFYLPALWALKLSILGLYLRIATERKHKIGLAVFATILTLHAFSATIANIFLCNPQKTIWDIYTFPKGCINILNFNYFNAAFHITSDVVLVTMPIPILHGLQISTRKRIGLVVVFSLGLAACVLTVIRVVVVIRWGNTPDFTWAWMPVALFTNLEINLAMIMACMPALNILMKRALKLDTSLDGSKGYELRDTDGTGAMRSSRTKMSSKRRNSTTIMSADNDSEQGIIQDLRPFGQNDEALTHISADHGAGGGAKKPFSGIVQTNEVQIAWEARR